MRNKKERFWLLGAGSGKWNPEERAQFEKEAARGAETARLLDEQLRLWKLLDAWDAPPVSAQFDRKLHRRMEEAATAPWYSRVFETLRAGSLWKPAVPLALATLMVFTGLFINLSHPVAVPPSAAGVTPVSLTDADQLEKSLNDLQLLHQVYPEASSTAQQTM